VEQFEGIRRDVRDQGISIRALAKRHGVHRRTVRQASPRCGIWWLGCGSRLAPTAAR
jgi:transposase-like protein